MSKEKILVVDDNPDMVEVISEIFIHRGFQVVTAGNGQEALAKVYQERPDLVLLDVMMPMLDGYEICRTLKSVEETKNIPVIFATVKGLETDIDRGFAVRADGYIVKPFDPTELPDFAEKVLAKVRSQQNITLN